MDVAKQSTTQQLSTRQLIKAELHATTRSFETFPRCFSLSPVFCSRMPLAHAHLCKETFVRHYDSCSNLYDVLTHKTHAPPVTISREQTRDATIKANVGSNFLPVLISCAKKQFLTFSGSLHLLRVFQHLMYVRRVDIIEGKLSLIATINQIFFEIL